MAADQDGLAASFERRRPRLRAVAQRILGRSGEADDAVQETWLRLSRSDVAAIEDLDAWLTTVVARVCLNVLRARSNRREEQWDSGLSPDPVVFAETDPEHEAVLAEAVSAALMVVLETLTPGERIAFVLHDLFGVPFGQIASLVERSPAATRQLASRARRRVQGASASVEVDLRRQREVVDAFFAAGRSGDLERLVAVLDPDVVLRSDGGALRPEASVVVHGAREVAGRAQLFARQAPAVRPVLVDGRVGVLVVVDDHVQSVMGFVVRRGRICAIEVLADPARLARLDLPVPRPSS